MAFIPRGIIPPVVTPTNEDGSFNPVMFDKLLNHLIDNGVHGLFPFGTTGEFYAFEDDDYRRIITQAVETVNHRVPVYAGANSITTKGTIRLAKIAKECGADALSVLTPMFISQTQAELYEHYRAIAESTDLPIIIYNGMSLAYIFGDITAGVGKRCFGASWSLYITAIFYLANSLGMCYS